MDESIERMNASSEILNAQRTMDEDVLNYLSTLTPSEQKLLDDFVLISDHLMPPAGLNFAYGNG